MVDECGALDRSLIAEVEAQVLPKAPQQTVAELRRCVRRAIAAADPVAVERRHQQAKAERGVRFVPEPDGMATIIARLAADDARLVFLAVDALARGRHTAEGGRNSGIGIDARRADALLDIAQAALAQRRLPQAQGRPVHLDVVIDLPTLLHLAEHPAELVGYGPLPASVARRLAGDAAWRRLVTDPITDPLTGHLLDYGRRTYRPPQPLIDFITARDRRCRFPGCGQPARRCDIDHATPWSAGGATAAANCGALCRRHHRLKTHGGWKLTMRPDGVAVWKTRTGREYAVSPPHQLGA